MPVPAYNIQEMRPEGFAHTVRDSADVSRSHTSRGPKGLFKVDMISSFSHTLSPILLYHAYPGHNTFAYHASPPRAPAEQSPRFLDFWNPSTPSNPAEHFMMAKKLTSAAQ
jgi:hypothetical protein